VAANILEIHGLKTYFFTHRGVVMAVDDINLEVKPGENFGLVGESGCGKSVTGLSILRMIDPPGRIMGGEILFEGENLLEKSESEMESIRGRRISMILQDPLTALNPMFTIGYQIAETLIQHFGLEAKAARDRAIDIMTRVGIPSAEERFSDYPHHFSGGMRQRIVIAAAIACSPSLLIADEPTTNLDVTIQAQILELLKELRTLGMSTILIAHHLGLVREMCDRIAVMYAGQIVEIADISRLRGHMRHPYTIGLLKCIPQRGHMSSRLPTISGTVPDLIDIAEGCRFSNRCPQALRECAHNKPGLLEIEPGHFVACHGLE
jgi:oligopeptide/dipeptide ABC transporter ATP-binding protein